MPPLKPLSRSWIFAYPDYRLYIKNNLKKNPKILHIKKKSTWRKTICPIPHTLCIWQSRSILSSSAIIYRIITGKYLREKGLIYESIRWTQKRISTR